MTALFRETFNELNKLVAQSAKEPSDKRELRGDTKECSLFYRCVLIGYMLKYYPTHVGLPSKLSSTTELTKLIVKQVEAMIKYETKYCHDKELVFKTLLAVRTF